ncbi:MAG: hypothetical protein NVSMB27_37450 [Ktedonobacteraceae bacterium]
MILGALTIWFLGGGNLLQHASVLSISIAFACFGTVGSLIALQRLKNTIGWIFCLVGIGTGITDFSGAYTSFGTAHGHILLPGSGIFNWLGDTIWPLNWGLMLVFLPLLFPNGHLLTRRWRFVSWLAAIMIVLSILTSQLAYLGPTSPASSWSDQGSLINLLELPLTIAALISLVLRFRRAKERERQQIKWLAYGTTIMVTLIVGGVLLLPDPNGLFQLIFPVAIICLPLSIGISILRHRLYDIDVLINRTLVYATLTALLALIYFGLIFASQDLLGEIIKSNNDVAIVISTLSIAALFRPLRARIQRIIDRRFYRQKYDATRTLAAFSAALRDEVDLHQLREHLLTVVEETVQPTHVSLWVRKEEKRRSPLTDV